MKIPAKVHYALLIMTDIAMQGENTTVTGNDIARRQNISFAFVAQLLNKLKHEGILKSVRGGVSGGYHLKESPAQVTVKMVIDAIEPKFCICPSHEIKTDKEVDDIIRSFWSQIWGDAIKRFETITIKDLATGIKVSAKKGESCI